MESCENRLLHGTAKWLKRLVSATPSASHINTNLLIVTISTVSNLNSIQKNTFGMKGVLELILKGCGVCQTKRLGTTELYNLKWDSERFRM